MSHVDDKAPASLRAYSADMRIFERWCAAEGLLSLPATPETVAAFLKHDAESGHKMPTVDSRRAGIRFFHQKAGYEPPTNAEIVKQTMRALWREYGKPAVKKQPITPDVVRELLPYCPDTLSGKRMKALLGLGCETALHRTELVSLTTRAFRAESGGLRWGRRIIRDQDWFTPVTWYLEWCQAAGIVDRCIFRPVLKDGITVLPRQLQGPSAATSLKKLLKRAGYASERFSVDSMRRGAIIHTAKRGASAEQLKRFARLRYLQSVEQTLLGQDFRFVTKGKPA